MRRAILLAAAAAVTAACGPAAVATAGRTVIGGGVSGLVRTVAVSTVGGPAGPATATRSSAACPAGTTLVGGGVGAALTGGGKPPSSLHTNGTLPERRSWVGIGDTGGQPVLGGATTALALCLTGGPARVTVTVAQVDGPGASRSTARATASCPPGTELLGGGGFTGDPSGGPGSPSLHLLGSYPSTAGGAPAAAGLEAGSWTAAAGAGGRQGAGLQTVSYAVCASWPGHRTIVARTTVPGPLAPGGSVAASSRCPARGTLLSGGVLAGQVDGKAPQQGLHLTGSYPGTRDPAEVASPSPGQVLPPAWTGRAEAGGQGSPPGTETTAFALCLTD